MKTVLSLFSLFSINVYADIGSFCNENSHITVEWSCGSGRPGEGWVDVSGGCYHYDTGRPCGDTNSKQSSIASSCHSGSFCNVNTIEWKCDCTEVNGQQGWVDVGGGCFHRDTGKSCGNVNSNLVSVSAPIVSRSGKSFDPSKGCGEDPAKACDKLINTIAVCPSVNDPSGVCACFARASDERIAWIACEGQRAVVECENGFSPKVKTMKGWLGTRILPYMGCIGLIKKDDGNIIQVSAGYDPDAPIRISDPCTPNSSGIVIGPCSSSMTFTASSANKEQVIQNNIIPSPKAVVDTFATTDFRCFQKDRGQLHSCANKSDAKCMDHLDVANLISGKLYSQDLSHKCLDNIKKVSTGMKGVLVGPYDYLKNLKMKRPSEIGFSFQDGVAALKPEEVLEKLSKGKSSLCELAVLEEARAISKFEIEDLLYPNISGITVNNSYSVASNWKRPREFSFDIMYINQVLSSCNYSLNDIELKRSKSNIKTCEINLKNDYYNYLAENNLLKNEISTLTFEYSALKNPALKNVNISDLNKLKELVESSQNNRKKFYEELDSKSAELTCLCMEAQNKDGLIRNDKDDGLIKSNCEKESMSLGKNIEFDSSGVPQKKFLSSWATTISEVFSQASANSAKFLEGASKFSLRSNNNSMTSAKLGYNEFYIKEAEKYAVEQGLVLEKDSLLLARLEKKLKHQSVLIERAVSRIGESINYPVLDLNLFMAAELQNASNQFSRITDTLAATDKLAEKELNSYAGTLQSFNSLKSNPAVKSALDVETASVKDKIKKIIDQKELMAGRKNSEAIRTYLKNVTTTKARKDLLTTVANIREIRILQTETQKKQLQKINSRARREKISKALNSYNDIFVLRNDEEGESRPSERGQDIQEVKGHSYSTSNDEDVIRKKENIKITETAQEVNEDYAKLEDAISAKQKQSTSRYANEGKDLTIFDMLTNAYIRNYEKVFNDKKN